MNSVNRQYSDDINRIIDKPQYNQDDLIKLREAGIPTSEIQELKAQKMFCHTNRFKRIKANKDSLIKQHLLLVVNIAKHYHRVTGKKNVPLDDVIQSGNIGLVIAADKYTEAVVPEKYKDIKFSTYAYHWIRKYVLDELNITSQQLTTGTRAAYEQRTKDNKYYSKDETFDDYKENPIANSLKSSYKDGEMVMELEEHRKQANSILTKMLNQLNTQERTVISALFGLHPFEGPLTNKEISKKFSLSPSTISNTRNRAIHKLYHSVTDKEQQKLLESAIVAGVDTRAVFCG